VLPPPSNGLSGSALSLRGGRGGLRCGGSTLSDIVGLSAGMLMLRRASTDRLTASNRALFSF